MTEGRRLQVSPGVAVATVLSVLIVGAGGTYLLMRPGRIPANSATDAGTSTAASQLPRPAPAGAQETPASRADVVVTLSKDAADRAGIEVTPVSAGTATGSLRVPGVVEANAYRQVAVTPLVGGRIVRVLVQLGDRVRKGQPIARIYSPELAEARTRYVAARAMLEAHDRELQRTEKLAAIGAASRQELERIHAEHAAQTAEVESARSRLQLLGAALDGSSSSTPQDAATTNVPAPIDGVVTERLANAGLNVDSTTKLFTIVDLSQVWVVGDVYERDLQHVREGARATVTTTAYPERPLAGRVSFIDPQLNAATRTARIRVEVPNPRGDLRLGMYTDVTIESPTSAPVLIVPKDAVQSIGDRQFVYVPSASDPTKFVEREVRLGRAVGGSVEVVAGIRAGDSVVSKGSFFVRAEAERLGLRSSQIASPPSPAAAARAGLTGIQTATIRVTEKGFEPDKVRVRAGSPARLTFVRTTDTTCGTEVAFPSLNITRALPLNEPVAVEFTPPKSGDVTFACGMNMLKGIVVVQ